MVWNPKFWDCDHNDLEFPNVSGLGTLGFEIPDLQDFQDFWDPEPHRTKDQIIFLWSNLHIHKGTLISRCYLKMSNAFSSTDASSSVKTSRNISCHTVWPDMFRPKPYWWGWASTCLVAPNASSSVETSRNTSCCTVWPDMFRPILYWWRWASTRLVAPNASSSVETGRNVSCRTVGRTV